MSREMRDFKHSRGIALLAHAHLLDFPKSPIQSTNYVRIERFAPSASNRDVSIFPLPQRRFHFAVSPTFFALRQFRDKVDALFPLAYASWKIGGALAEEESFDDRYGNSYRRSGAEIEGHMAVPKSDARAKKLDCEDNNRKRSYSDQGNCWPSHPAHPAATTCGEQDVEARGNNKCRRNATKGQGASIR